MSPYIKSLQDAIQRLHGCASSYLETVPVEEVFRGKTVWAGEVQVFEIIGHPKAKRCYAWNHLHGAKDEKTRFVTVLEIPPVKDARTAVQAAIVSEARKK